MRMLTLCRTAIIRTVIILLLSAVIAHTAPAAPPVMLAHTWTPEMDIRGWWMSEKFDGIRGYWTGRELVSRSGYAFATPREFTANFPSVPLDGELWISRQQFAEISSIVRRQQPGPEWERVRYLIFDAPEADGGFEQRLDFARQWFQHHPNPYVAIVPHEICRDASHLQDKLEAIEALGGEGVMLRRPQSPYTAGRSYDLLKVKRFQDTEAVVIEHLPGSGRHAGRLGAILVELPNGVRFEIGSGFSDAERDNPPPIGSTITFKYQGLTKSGKPRFATFLRVREKL